MIGRGSKATAAALCVCVALLLAAVLSACGGGGSDTTTSASQQPSTSAAKPESAPETESSGKSEAPSQGAEGKGETQEAPEKSEEGSQAPGTQPEGGGGSSAPGQPNAPQGKSGSGPEQGGAPNQEKPKQDKPTVTAAERAEIASILRAYLAIDAATEAQKKCGYLSKVSIQGLRLVVNAHPKIKSNSCVGIFTGLAEENFPVLDPVSIGGVEKMNFEGNKVEVTYANPGGGKSRMELVEEPSGWKVFTVIPASAS